MSTLATARLLVGRKIVGLELRRFQPHDRGHPGPAYDPVLILDNGARVTFVVQETGAEYGVEPIYHPRHT